MRLTGHLLDPTEGAEVPRGCGLLEQLMERRKRRKRRRKGWGGVRRKGEITTGREIEKAGG